MSSAPHNGDTEPDGEHETVRLTTSQDSDGDVVMNVTGDDVGIHAGGDASPSRPAVTIQEEIDVDDLPALAPAPDALDPPLMQLPQPPPQPPNPQPQQHSQRAASLLDLLFGRRRATGGATSSFAPMFSQARTSFPPPTAPGASSSSPTPAAAELAASQPPPVVHPPSSTGLSGEPQTLPSQAPPQPTPPQPQPQTQRQHRWSFDIIVADGPGGRTVLPLAQPRPLPQNPGPASQSDAQPPPSDNNIPPQHPNLSQPVEAPSDAPNLTGGNDSQPGFAFTTVYDIVFASIPTRRPNAEDPQQHTPQPQEGDLASQPPNQAEDPQTPPVPTPHAQPTQTNPMPSLNPFFALLSAAADRFSNMAENGPQQPAAPLAGNPHPSDSPAPPQPHPTSGESAERHPLQPAATESPQPQPTPRPAPAAAGFATLQYAPSAPGQPPRIVTIPLDAAALASFVNMMAARGGGSPAPQTPGTAPTAADATAAPPPQAGEEGAQQAPGATQPPNAATNDTDQPGRTWFFDFNIGGAGGMPPGIAATGFEALGPFGQALATALAGGLPFIFGGGMDRERPPDFKRAKELIGGLRKVPDGLVRRLERVERMEADLGHRHEEGGDSEADKGQKTAICSVCYDPLLVSSKRKAMRRRAKLRSGVSSVSRSPTPSTPIGSTSTLHPAPALSGDTLAAPPSLGESKHPKSRPPPKEGWIVALPCGHIFHSRCLAPWFARRTTCPVCRMDVDPASETLRLPNDEGFGQQTQGRHHPYTRDTSSGGAAARRKWTPPEGKRVRVRVEEREKKLGLRCDCVSCAVAPVDEDEERMLSEMVTKWTLKLEEAERLAPPEMLTAAAATVPAPTQAEGDVGEDERMDEDDAGATEDDADEHPRTLPVFRRLRIRPHEPSPDLSNDHAQTVLGGKRCDHELHAQCLVTASRVAGFGPEHSQAGDDNIEVACPTCRVVGTISKEEWAEGERDANASLVTE